MTYPPLRVTGKGNRLFEFAALLVAPLFVTGALAAPAAPAAPLVVAVGEAPPAPGAGILIPVDRLQGIALLDRLGALPRSEVRTFLATHPERVGELLAAPPLASDVAAWWNGAPVSGRSALRTLAPELIGNLEGVPYAARDLANRAVLDAAQRQLDDRLAGALGRAERAELQTRTHMLEQVEQALWGDSRRLLSLDVTGDGRAVIAVGDITTADYVSFLVPGMFFGVDAQIVAWADTAQTLVNDQRAWLRTLHPGSDATVAAVAWIGYATPGLVNVASMELAREGQQAFTASLQGVRAARGDAQPFLSVLAHSYGSTAAMLSLTEDNVHADALAVVGSPGSPARSADELHVGSVWVGAAEWDPIPASGVFGSQPSSRSYGAKLFSVAAGTDPLSGATLGGTLSHNDYFSPGSMSLRNLTLISLGEGERVTGPEHSRGDFARALTRIR